MLNKKVSHLFYTDNLVLGGGNQYFVDMINAAYRTIENILVVTNNHGFFKEDYERLRKKTIVISINRINSQSLAKFFISVQVQSVLIKKISIFISKILSPLYFVFNAIIFVRLLKKHEPEYVIASNGGYPAAESVLAMVVAARIRRIPSVLTIVSMPVKRRWYFYPYDYLLDKIVPGFTNRIIVNSFAQVNALNLVRGFPKNKIECIYNAVPDIDSTLVRNKYQTGEQISIGVVSRLSKDKGHDILINAFAALSLHHKNIRLSILGDGPEYPYLIDLCKKLKIDNIVQFCGYVSDYELKFALSRLDIFVFPSLWEGLPYIILEALRAGLPIISTNVGGIPEVVRHMIEGILVNPGSTVELFDAMSFLLNDRKLINQMAINSRERYTNCFTLDEMEKKFNNLLYELANNPLII